MAYRLSLLLLLLPGWILAQGRRPPVLEKPFVVETSSGFSFRSLEDDHGGFYLIWSHPDGPRMELLSQHVGADGRLLWPGPGVPLVTSSQPIGSWEAVADSQNGLVIAWESGSQ